MVYFGKEEKTKEEIYIDNAKEDIIRSIKGNSHTGSVVLGFVGAFALWAMINLGPIDFMRSAYNQIIGDTSNLKYSLTDYSRNAIHNGNPKLSDSQIEKQLAKELNVKLGTDGKINPLEASISDLWDASEDHAPNIWQQYIWPSLK